MNETEIQKLFEENGIRFNRSASFGLCSTGPITLDGLTKVVNQAIKRSEPAQALEALIDVIDEFGDFDIERHAELWDRAKRAIL